VLVGSNSIGPFQAIADIVPWFHGDSSIAKLASGLLFLALALTTARAARQRIM